VDARANTHFELGNGLVQRMGKRQQHLHVPGKTSERHNTLKVKFGDGLVRGARSHSIAQRRVARCVHSSSFSSEVTRMHFAAASLRKGGGE
jgi:hypothetical protein